MSETQNLKVLSFYLNDDLFAAPVTDVSEVNKIYTLRTVPKAPDSIVGLINLHGLTTAVLNTKKLLDIEPSELGENSRWIATNWGKSMVCFTVDQMHKIMVVALEEMDEVPQQVALSKTGYLMGCARVDDLIIPVLNLPKILDERLSEIVSELSDA
jgi:purine-binding chemotaxis protein CheW